MGITAVSLFSGCGGFDYGVQKAGVDIIWANDIDSVAASAYRSILPDVKFVEGDISKVKLNDIPVADMLIGCYPCTGFSQASRRRSKSLEPRDLHARSDNFLYQEFLRVLDHIKPKFLLVENVAGMLSASGGWFWEQQKMGFRDLGYEIRPFLILASDYGLAQDRKRVFIVGLRQDISSKVEYQLPEPTHGNGLLKKTTIREALKGLEHWPEGEFNNRPFHGHYLTRNRKRGWDDQSYTIVAHWDHVTLHPSGAPMKKVGPDEWKLCGDMNRRLSWKECARIQGLPDKMIPDGSLKDKYRVVGNAVPPILGKVLAMPLTNGLRFV